MYQYIARLLPLFFFLTTTVSYAQFEKQLLLELSEADAAATPNYGLVTTLDADQDGDQDVVGEVTPDDVFNPVYINFNNLLKDNANGWNNLQREPVANSSLELTDILGRNSGAVLTLKTDWNGGGDKGYIDDREDFYPKAVTRSYYFTTGTEQISISGLDPTREYKFSFYASSAFSGDRTAIYRIGAQEVELDASFNTTNVVTIADVAPDTNGEVIIEVAKKVGASYAFLGSLIIEPNRQAPRQYVLLTNDGQPPFDETTSIDNASNWAFAKSVDLNQDSYPDLLAYDTEEQHVLWYKNEAGASFSKNVIISTSSSPISSENLLVLDLNQDGRLDIAAAEDHRLYWYEQLSDNSFADEALWTEVTASESPVSSSVIQGNIDGDNLSDIIWQYGTQLRVLGSQSTYTAGTPIPVEGVSSALLLTATDMNGDSQDDLLITETYAWTGVYRVGYLLNNSGTISTSPTFLTITDFNLLSQRPQRLMPDDVDQDGDLDFYVYTSPEACSSIEPPQSGWIENLGSWQSATYHAIQVQNTTQWVDLDQDGDQDLLGSSLSGPGIYWAENVDGRWNNVAYQALDQPVIDQIKNVLLSDINQDTYADLVIQSTAHVARLNNQQGTNLPPSILGQINSTNASVTFGDVDADDVQELFIADVNADGYAVIHWTESSSRLSKELVTHQGSLSGKPIFFSEEGQLFAPVNESGSQYGWWKKNGDGNYVLAATLDGPITQIADLNGDKLTDVVTETGWYRNTNNGFQSMNNAQGRQVVDFDGDGDLDVVAVPENGSAAWYKNDGSGGFSSVSLSLTVEETMYFADLDADGDADLIQSTSAGSSWRPNTDGQGTWGTAATIDSFVASQVQAADVDADGDMDIVANDSRVLVLYRNVYQKQENTAPLAQTIIDDQTAIVDEAYEFQLPSDAFVDNDAGDVLTYQAHKADGSELPAWLAFDQDTRSFSGTPAEADTGTITLQVQVADLQQATASQTFDLTVSTEDSPDDGEDPDEEDPDEDPDDEDPDEEDPVTSIGEEQPQEVVLYPNPVVVGERIIVKNVPTHEFKEGRMYTAQGKIVSVLSPPDDHADLIIDSSSLTPGLYLLEIYTTRQMLRRKIIVR